MKKNSPQNTPSLATSVTNFDRIIEEAMHLAREHVSPGDEDAMIFRLGKYKMDVLQPLIGLVHFETGDNSLDDTATEGVLDDEAMNRLKAVIDDIEHRRHELEALKSAKTV